ncbi:hypothetical protein EYC84_001800 [Monilinia fructicola]|uniref:Uncharacterized protein n=1 Tax=Monilinia fructicola TaxID=38448 RepID=A0A5M9JYP3_MONFR|nr:hypothetical protein EYC84_001800 [Monilinia fructicola]
MAEIGVIASGMGVASLGLQLMDGIRKLKEFWDEVKNAPEDIQYAIGHLETLSSVLSDIHTENPDLPPIPSVTATKCLNLCQRGVDMLSMTVKDLNGAISKGRRIGGAKVVLRKDTLEKFRNRLRDAQYMLILARQTYSEALQHEYHKIQIETAQNNARLQQRGFQELGSSITRSVELLNCAVASKEIPSSQVIASDDESHHDTITSVQSRTQLRTTKQTKLFQIKLKMPQWFSHTNYTLDFSGFQAPSGWTFSFRQYYIVDYDSPAMFFTVHQDLTELQLLLKSKNATPFDKFSHGETLLDCAFKYGSYNIVELLLNEGADFDYSYTGFVYFMLWISPDTHDLQRLSYYWSKARCPGSEDQVLDLLLALQIAKFVPRSI